MCAGLVRRDRQLSGDYTVRRDIQSTFWPTDTFTYPHFHKDYSYGVYYAHFQFAKATTASLRITKVYQALCMTSKVMKSAKPPASRPERSGPNSFLPSPRRAFGTDTV